MKKILNLALSLLSNRNYELGICKTDVTREFMFVFNNAYQPLGSLSLTLAIVFLLLYGVDNNQFSGFTKYQEDKIIHKVKIEVSFYGPFLNTSEMTKNKHLNYQEFTYRIKYRSSLLDTLNIGLEHFLRSIISVILKNNELVAENKDSFYQLFTVRLIFYVKSLSLVNESSKPKS